MRTGADTDRRNAEHIRYLGRELGGDHLKDDRESARFLDGQGVPFDPFGVVLAFALDGIAAQRQNGLGLKADVSADRNVGSVKSLIVW